MASRHLVSGNCSNWIQFERSGCGKTWAETRGESFAFTCKGCTEVTALVKEVEGLRQMVDDIIIIIIIIYTTYIAPYIWPVWPFIGAEEGPSKY